MLLVCNPNNPTGEIFPRTQLLDWHRRLQHRGGWLIVDEAYADCVPELSLAADSACDGLIVLRSLGKFFGLAGARVGFALAAEPILRALREELGPWTLCGASRSLARAALADAPWQAEMRTQLPQRSARLRDLLQRHRLHANGGCALFQWVPTPRARAIQQALAARGIWVRGFDTPPSLRFGLPAASADWQRLDAALREVMTRERCEA